MPTLIRRHRLYRPRDNASGRMMADYHKPVFDNLTPREMSVLRSLCEGLSIDETGARYGIAGRTVKNTLRFVYIKLGLNQLAGSRAPRACYLLALHEMRRMP